MNVNDLINECESRCFHCSVTYQSINDISIEIYKGYKKNYELIFYTDGHVDLIEALNDVEDFFNNA